MTVKAAKRTLFPDWNLHIEVASSANAADDVISFASKSLGRDVNVEPTLVHQPDGIRCAAVSAGIKYEGVLDFTVVKLDAPGSAAAVYTRSLCPSYAVQYGREILKDGKAQALAVISKNANVFTPHGDAAPGRRVVWLAEELRAAPPDIAPSGTGVIGVALPMDKIKAAIPG